MAAPTYRCPFKIRVSTPTDQGIVCEGVNCAAYDGVTDHCSIVEFVQRQIALDGKANPNNQ